jgi:hypothetical protein
MKTTTTQRTWPSAAAFRPVRNLKLRCPTLWALAATAVLGVSPVAPLHSQVTDRITEDTALFAAVLGSVTASVKIPIEADPRPAVEIQAVRTSSTAAIVDALGAMRHKRREIPAAVLDGRRATLRQLGITEADSTTWKGCSGVLTPLPYKDVTRCPPRNFLVATVGLPRPGDEGLPFEGATGEFLRGGKNVRFVRALLTHLGPDGFNMEEYWYMFEMAGGHWRLVKKILVGITE